MAKYKGFRPNWQEKRAPEGSYRELSKWGDPEAFKVPKEKLYGVLKETFDMTDEDFKIPKDTGYDKVEYDAPITLGKAQLKKLADIVGADNMSTDNYQRLRVAYGKSGYDVIRLVKKIVENVPDVVLYPSTEEQIEQLVAFAHQEEVPLYIFSGGSSVTRGTECTKKGSISLDLGKHFNKVIEFNEINQTITVQPGISGPELERLLNNAVEEFGAKRAYTCGHFPQSFEYSTVGGWVVTRGAGQNSTYYGKIEHMVLGQKYITPVGGPIITDTYPAKATGPDINQIMIGSEGTFGVLTQVTLRVFRLTKHNRKKYCYMFRTFEESQAAAREIMQSEFGYPYVFRVSDGNETAVMTKMYGVDDIPVVGKLFKLLGFVTGKKSIMIAWSEGEKGFAKNQRRKIAKICRKYKAFPLTGYPVSEWEKGRFTDPYLRDSMMDFGITTETMECSVNWDNMDRVHKEVMEYCLSRPHTVCMTHLSHAYPQGANLYWIFITKDKGVQDFLEYQKGILSAIQKAGATMSHHHGIGKLFAPYLEGQIGSNQLKIFKTLKEHFDPKNVMNPGGTLALDLDDSEKVFAREKW